MVAGIFFFVIAASVVVAFWAGYSKRKGSVSEYLVGGRSFPAWLLYFLAVGEIYSIGTMIGLPSGLYAGGANYGIWFLGYILMAYPLGYFLAPLIWRSGVRYDAMTIPDVFGRHFGSRTLEVVTAVAILVALVPWGQYQFIGMQVVLGGLGLKISPVAAVTMAGAIAFVYLIVSGVRSPAFVAILKDIFMVLGVVIVGVFAVHRAGGVSPIFDKASIPASMTTLSGSPLVFTISTIVFQSVAFYLSISAAYLFTSKSERAIKSATVWMPLYMLMYPFLVLGSFFAVTAYPKLANPNTVFMKVAIDILPDWLVGVVAAGAGLSGILVLAVTALGIGGTVTRNLVPHVRYETQKRVSNLVVVVFLVVAAALTLQGSTLMLKVLNLVYYLFGQFIPGWLAIMFFRWVKPWAVSAGIISGVAVSLLLYNAKPDLGGLNAGLVAVAVNLALMFGLSLLGTRESRLPMAAWRPGQAPAEDTSGSHQAPGTPATGQS